MNYANLTAGQKSAFTRRARVAARTRSETGYRVAELMLRDHVTTADAIAETVGLTNYQARGYMSRVTAGDFNDCRLS